MNTPDTVLLGVAVLTTLSSGTEGLEFEVSGCEGEQKSFHRFGVYYLNNICYVGLFK
jgi:hypothetical protein